MGTCSVLREEFRLVNFGFSYQNKDAFVYSLWRWHRGVFLSFRIFTALWCSGCFLYLVSALDGGLNNIMTYLTTWTYLVLTLYLVSAALIALFHGTCTGKSGNNDADLGIPNESYTDSEKPTSMTLTIEHNKGVGFGTINPSSKARAGDVIDIPWYMKTTWLLGNIVYVFAIIVTCVYFGALFPLIGTTNFIDVNVHGVNTCFVLIDACLIARPVRLLHVVYPVVYGALYLVFSAIYWNADKVNHVLYPGVLDWNFPAHTSMVVCLLTFVALPFLQIVHFVIYRFRLNIYKQTYGENYGEI